MANMNFHIPEDSSSDLIKRKSSIWYLFPVMARSGRGDAAVAISSEQYVRNYFKKEKDAAITSPNYG